MQYRNNFFLSIILLFITSTSLYAAQSSGLQEPEKSVFLIITYRQEYNFVTPWKVESMSQSSGTGFLIADNLILTNAHNVSDYKYLELRKENVAGRFLAKVLFVGHDCDLAVLTVEDNSFFNDTTALELSDLPKVNSTVSTYGFPMGGDRISVTEGVVSRIESDIYAHSGADGHLVIQTDAAINPGNSGGPVIQNGKVTGVAFQGLQEADNIGYMIPTTVIKHFLKDIKDGKYDSFGSMGAMFFPGLHNDSYRKYLKVPNDQDGLVVIGTLLNSSVESILQKNDVLTKIDYYNIDNDGMITINGLRSSISEAVESKQIGETLNLTFYRQGELKTATATIALNRPIFEQALIYDQPPPYVCYAGLIFIKATRNYLETWGPRWPREIPFYLKYLFANSSEINEEPKLKEYVVLSEVMADEINSYAAQYKNKVLEEINGHKIYSLNDVSDAFKNPSGDFYSIKFMGDNRILPIEVKKARDRQQDILNKYEIPAGERLEVTQ
ncbi:MAG: trypsin-like peptidase domain-containing protein [Sedimentisphaerales bacterium]|nr:trypsin-like peptidase domain-containing protein [Sedimentisphaerales bacterium]